MRTLDAVLVLRAQEQMDGGAWKREEAGPVRVQSKVGQCAVAGCEGRITYRNRTGICRECWSGMSPKRRREVQAAAQEAA